MGTKKNKSLTPFACQQGERATKIKKKEVENYSNSTKLSCHKRERFTKEMRILTPMLIVGMARESKFYFYQHPSISINVSPLFVWHAC